MVFRKLAADVLAYEATALVQAVETGAFVEVFCEPADAELAQ